MPLSVLIDVTRAGLAQSPGPQGGALSMVLMLGVMFAIIYFLMIRPQQKQQKKHRDFLSKLKKGDEVVTQSGFLGRVFAVEESVVTLELADKVKVRVLKHAVANMAPGTEPAAADDSSKK
ncbi:MAG: preprotein translocase subunit YajC [Pseudomonadota bacterium]